MEELPGLSVKSLAKKFEISASHLSREFQKQKKMKLSLFIEQVKITWSANLMIIYPDLTIEEIAKKVGYSLKQFIKNFRSYFLLKPSMYRDLRYHPIKFFWMNGFRAMKQDKIQKILEYIVHCKLEELSEISVNSLARRFKISRPYLSNEFYKKKNVYLSHFISQVKLTRSIKLMATRPELSIKEIAHMVGFGTPGYYRSVFKRYYYVNPSIYRASKY